MLNGGERISHWSFNVVVLGEIGMDLSHVSLGTSSDTIEVLAQIRVIRPTQKSIQGVDGTPVGIRALSSVSDEHEVGMEKATTVNRISVPVIEVFVEELIEGRRVLILGSQDRSVPGDFIKQQLFGDLEFLDRAWLVGSFLRVAKPITNVSLILQTVLLVVFIGDQVFEGDGVVGIDVMNGPTGIIDEPGECIGVLPDSLVV